VIIDAHCHVWPDQIAELIVGARPAGMDAVGDGTLSGLLRTMDSAGIAMACTLAIANEARHVARTNEFIGRVDRSRFIPCGTVHAGLSAEENLASLSDNGIRAVKFHPNFQGMSLGAPETLELFSALAEEGVVVLSHVGEGSDESASERGAPHHVASIIAAVPTLRFVAFHFGGFHRLDEAAALDLRDTVWLETSWPPTVSALGADRVLGIIESFGANRFVFGSDWPMANPAAEIAFIRSLGLPAADEAAILGGTLARVLGIS
jgi:uncharacterized protein